MFCIYLDDSFVESDGFVTWSIPTKACGAIGCEVTFFTLKSIYKLHKLKGMFGWGEKREEEKVLKDTLYKNTLNLLISPTPYIIHLTCDLMTFASSSFSLYLRSTTTSRFPSLTPFFFSFFLFALFNQHSNVT